MSQSAKTGGNKKSSSPSDTAYFLRRKASNRDQVNRDKRIARHAKRMAKKAAHRLLWAGRKAKPRKFSEPMVA